MIPKHPTPAAGTAGSCFRFAPSPFPFSKSIGSPLQAQPRHILSGTEAGTLVSVAEKRDLTALLRRRPNEVFNSCCEYTWKYYCSSERALFARLCTELGVGYCFDFSIVTQSAKEFRGNGQKCEYGRNDRRPHEFSIRLLDTNVGEQPRVRRRQRRPQSAVPNRGPAINPVGAQTSVLNIRLHDARSAGAVSRVLRCGWSAGYPSRK